MAEDAAQFPDLRRFDPDESWSGGVHMGSAGGMPTPARVYPPWCAPDKPRMPKSQGPALESQYLRKSLSRDGRAHTLLPVNPKPSKDPLHGVTLERLLTELVERHGWAELGRQVPVRCFLFDPSVKSSLVFLRRTPWARARVEALYVEMRRS